MTRRRLIAIPSPRGPEHRAALRHNNGSVQDGQPGNTTATAGLRARFRAANAIGTCGHPDATITVLTGEGRLTACGACLMESAARRDVYIPSPTDHDGGDAA